jgi:hypothetical protein
MSEIRVRRRLVKSPPELWAEVSDEGALSRRLEQFGDVRIARIEPEKRIAWEGRRAHGTVEIESSGWGTAVVLTAHPAAPPEPDPPPAPAAPPRQEEASPGPQEPPGEEETTPEEQGAAEDAGLGFFARLFRWRDPAGEGPGPQPGPPQPGPPQPPSPTPEPPSPGPQPGPPQPPVPGPEPPQPGPAPGPPSPPDPNPPSLEPAADGPMPPSAEETREVLEGVLDALGTAHHRPFSRA